MSEPIDTAEMDGAAKAAQALHMAPGVFDATVDTTKEIAPDIGALLEGATRGPGGFALAAAGVIFRHETDKITEQDKELDELAGILAEPLGANIEDFNKHVQERKLAVAKLQAEVVHAGTDLDPIGTRFRTIRAFMDVLIEDAKNEVAAQGRNVEVTLLGQNATSQQIIAARQQIRAKIRSLDELKNFIDGSGLLMLEQAVRQKVQPQLYADSRAAVLAQQQVKNKNDDRQKEIQQLENETGRGKLGKQDPVYVFDQKRIAEAQEDLDQAEQIKKSALDLARQNGVSPDRLREIAKPYDEEIAEAKEKLEEVTTDVQQKSVLLLKRKEKQDEVVGQEANAAVNAEQASEEVTQNQHRIDELPRDIAFAQFLEQMQRSSNTQVAATDAQTDQKLEALPPADFGLPLNFSGGAGAGGGRRLNPERLNEILAGLVQGQDALKKSQAEAQVKQAQMEAEIESLQETNRMLSRQIRELQRTGGK